MVNNENFDLDENLGKKAKDKVTGKEGIITGYIVSLFGCKQYCLNPGLDKDGKNQDTMGIDEGRVEILGIGIRPKKVRAKSGKRGSILNELAPGTLN